MTDNKIPAPSVPTAATPPRPVAPPAPPTLPNMKMPNPTMPSAPVVPPAPAMPAARANFTGPSPTSPNITAPPEAGTQNLPGPSTSPKISNSAPPTPSPLPTKPAPMKTPGPPAATAPVKPPVPPVSPKPPGASVSTQPGQLPPPNLPPTTAGVLRTPPTMQPPQKASTGLPANAASPSGAPATLKSLPPTAPGQASAAAGGSGTPTPPQKAEAKKSIFRFLPFAALFAVVLGLGYFLFTTFFTPPAQDLVVSNPNSNSAGTVTTQSTSSGSQVTLTYWGLWENDRIVREVLSDFEKQNPNIKVNYMAQSHRDYRERLQTAIVGKRGPDVFRFHATWVPMLRAELDPMPSSVYTPSEFQNTFYPIASQQLMENKEYVGVPLMYEGLALLYNKEILRAANAEPPKTWAELERLASQLTVRDGNTIKRAGLAIGNASNVEHFSDIVGLLIYQSGGSPANPTSKEVQDALTYYTNFIRTPQTAVWNENLPASSVAFARGEVAMIFAPSWRVHEIRNQNPNLSFGVATVPQLGSNRVTWASYWAEGVNTHSNNKEESWKLLKYLSSKEVLQKFHSAAAKERSFGEIYSRTDMATELAGNEYVAAYLQDAPYAQSWYLSSFTHDNGINDQIIKYYENAVNSMGRGSSSNNPMATVEQGIRQVLRQFGVVVPAAATTPAR